MSDLKAIGRRFYDEIINGGNLDLIDDLIHDDFVEHELIPGVPEGKEAPRVFMNMLRAGFPDVRMTIEDMVEEGEMLVVRARMTGTHEGEFMSIPATGNKIEVALVDMVRFEDGQVIEHWGLMDALAMMQQLGVIPAQ